ncbi:hypothetical protein [Fodinibius saliphilus]|uniref:hypothetical protein n=1 Tax=Fodinibius saliphilus TaxID=1920650 RepID=UPI0011092D16|nr:hypothetical protein [Fodinibius saliphilus]
MNEKKTTVGRFCIAFTCICLGIMECISPASINISLNQTLGPIIPDSFAVVALTEIAAGFLLLVKHKYNYALSILIGDRVLVLLFLASPPSAILLNISLIGGLLLLVNRAGKSLLEIMRPDIQNLPNYKTTF